MDSEPRLNSQQPGQQIDRRQFGRFAGLVAAAGGLAACSSSDPEDSETSAENSTSTSADDSGSTTTPVAEPAEVTVEDVGLPPLGDGPHRVIIDTDAANEIDDQFGLAWALLVPEQIKIEAITAAPYSYGSFMGSLLEAQELRGDGPRTPFEVAAQGLGPDGIASLTESNTPEAGMNKSLEEIDRFVELVAPADVPPTFAGATSYMASESEPVESDAAQAIVDAANAGDSPLYVMILGAPTNVASALLIDPSIADKIVVIFVAGFPSASREVDESFNLLQDKAASRVIFEKSGPLVYIPGYNVAESLSISLSESEKYLSGKGALGDALHELMVSRLVSDDGEETPGTRWVMWDMAPIAWLLDPERLVLSSPTTRGTINDEHRWEPIDGAMMESYRVDDKAVFIDFLALF